MPTEIDASGFVRMCEGLASIAGKDYREIVVPQVGQLLRACVRRQGPRRSDGVIAKRVSAQGSYIEFSDGTKINTWRKADHATMFFDHSPKGMAWHAMNDPNRHWSNDRWARFQAKDRERVAIMQRKYREALSARGLAHKTWKQIADDLGLNLGLPAWVNNARDAKGRTFKEGLAMQLLDQAAFIVEIVNSNPLVVGKLNGRAILEGAIRDREKAFDYDIRKGVFDDVKRRAQRYPGIFAIDAGA